MGRTIALIEFSPTGNDFVEALTTVNRSVTSVTTLTTEDIAMRKSEKKPGFVGLDALFKEMWGEGVVIDEEDVWEVKGTPKRSFLDYVEALKANPPLPPKMPSKA